MEYRYDGTRIDTRTPTPVWDTEINRNCNFSINQAKGYKVFKAQYGDPTPPNARTGAVVSRY